MLETRGQADFALASLDADGGGGLRGEHLDLHLALDLHFFRKEDAAHPAATELAQDAVTGADRVLHLALEISQAVHLE